jgi:hypothetical protein
VYQVSGQEQTITDYVTIPDGTWKLKQLADAIGQRQAFDSGVFDPAEHINSYFVVELVVEDNEGYSPRNKVKRYAVAARKSPSTPSAKAAAVDRQAAQAQAGGDPISDKPQFKGYSLDRLWYDYRAALLQQGVAQVITSNLQGGNDRGNELLENLHMRPILAGIDHNVGEVLRDIENKR